MKEVDARGLSCPEPLMLTAEALKNANGPIKVLVSEPHQKTNIEKFAKDKGSWCTGTYDSGAEKYFSRMRAFLVRTTGMQGRTEKCHAGNRS